MSNFTLVLENRIHQILQNFTERRKLALIKSGYLIFSDQFDIEFSAYSVAFLELFFEIRHEIIVCLNKELDVFFTLHREWTGAIFEGVVPPSDNSTEWIYRVGLLKGGFNRVAYLEFQFHEWSIVKYSLHNSF